MKSERRWPSVLSLALLGSCTAAPKQTVELAEIVDQQIAAMQSSHMGFVRLYYDKLKSDVDHFLVTEWIPAFLANAVASDQFQGAIAEIQPGMTMDPDELVTRIAEATSLTADQQALVADALARLRRDADAEFGEIMIDFADEATYQIEQQRAEMYAPIDAQRELVLARLQEGYADLQRGTAALKGYLASVVNLAEARDQVLEKTNLLDEHRGFLSAAVRVSEGAARALEVARSMDEASETATDFVNTLSAFNSSAPNDSQRDED